MNIDTLIVRGGNMGDRNGETTRIDLKRLAAEEPELAVRMMLQSIPLAAAGTDLDLEYGLAVEDVGEFHVTVCGGKANVAAGAGQGGDFRVQADARTLARVAAGANPLWFLLSGKIHIRGNRLKALQLRRINAEGGLRELAKLGVPIDADLVFRSLPYAIDPEWARGERFTVKYELTGENGGSWFVRVNDGDIHVTRDLERKPDAVVRIAYESWLKLLRGEMTPAIAYGRAITEVEGVTHYVTLLGRWMERANGNDDKELEREERQRRIQHSRIGTWGSKVTSATGGDEAVPADPAVQTGNGKGPRLLSYEELYALWERQNWCAHELDFTIDKEQWITAPTEAQQHTAWGMGSFYVGEERVCSDLAPFVMAAPSGEIEGFLATQLVDEMRHAVFFDRFAAEVMALESNTLRDRLQEMEDMMLDPWHRLFDDELRGIANYLRDHPDDLDAFVEGVTIYHMVIEGVNAMTGQHVFLGYTRRHDLYPGFQKGFSLVEQDEHRHIAFGVRFLKEMVDRDPKYRDLIERKIRELVPSAALLFVPPYIEDPSDFVSYDYSSREVYGFAYRTLKRRMSVIGVEVPPPEELMPGPIDGPVPVAADTC